MTDIHHVVGRLLSPFTYHSFPDAGAAGATVTAPFLGDIALTYAMHYAIDGSPIPNRFGRNGPDYSEDYKSFPRRATMGVPLRQEGGPSQRIRYLPPEFTASSFMSEGYEQKRISSMDSKHRRSAVSSTPYRPWRQVQSIAPGVEFEFAVVTNAPLPEQFTLRIGLQRGTLVHVRRARARPDASVNRFTVESILGRKLEEGTVRESPLAHYQIHHGIPSDQLAALLGP